MAVSWKWGVSLTFLLIFATIVTAHSGAPGPTVNVLVFCIYLVPLALASRRELSRREMAFYLVLAPVAPTILLIGPMEPGLFGTDPYFKSLPAMDAVATGDIAGAIEYGDRPGFYYLPIFLSSVLAIPLQIAAKYVPLVTFGTPLLLFVGVSRWMPDEPAFLAALSLAGTRTMLSFHSKFVNETLGMLALTVAIAVVAVVIPRYRRIGIGLVVLVGIVSAFTHHYSSAVFTLFVLVWAFGPTNIRPLSFPDEFHSQRRKAAVVVVVALFVLVFLLTPGVTSRYVGIAIEQLLGSGYLASRPGLSAPPETALDYISRLAIIPLLVFVSIVGFGMLSRRYEPRSWTTSWSVAAGVLGVAYAVTLFGGRIVPLDPIRILLPLVLFLVPAALAIVYVADVLPTFVIDSRRCFATVLVAAFLATQIAALPPSVLYYTPDEPTSPTIDRSRTAVEFGATSWTATYSDDTIYDEDFGIWRHAGNDAIRGRYDEGQCGGVLRPVRTYHDPPEPYPEPDAVIYDAGSLHLHRC